MRRNKGLNKLIGAFLAVTLFVLPIASLLLKTTISSMNVELTHKQTELKNLQLVNSNREIVINESLTRDNIVAKLSNLSLDSKNIIYVDANAE